MNNGCLKKHGCNLGLIFVVLQTLVVTREREASRANLAKRFFFANFANFSFFAIIKLGHCVVDVFFYYVTNTQA